MSLNLDARQRAMLQEMRIPFWWPDADAPQADEAAPDAIAVAQAPDAPARPAVGEPSAQAPRGGAPSRVPRWWFASRR